MVGSKEGEEMGTALSKYAVEEKGHCFGRISSGVFEGCLIFK